MHYWVVLSAITDTYTFMRKSMMGKPCIIPSTRPEIIKMSPVVRACERRGSDWFVVHTGQGCSCDVDQVFVEQPGLLDAKDNLVGNPLSKAPTISLL